jgi:hypothetical protein
MYPFQLNYESPSSRLLHALHFNLLTTFGVLIHLRLLRQGDMPTYGIRLFHAPVEQVEEPYSFFTNFLLAPYGFSGVMGA